eukprot:10729008-Heterocapsa_arctica.AAC.1
MASSQAESDTRTWTLFSHSESSSANFWTPSWKARLEVFCWLVTMMLRSVNGNIHSAMQTT